MQDQPANAYVTGETGVPIAEAARVLGVNIRAIRWMCAAGKLRCFFTTGGDWQVVTADLEAARQGSAAAAPANRSPSQPSPIVRQEKERVEESALQELEDEERQRADGKEAAQQAHEQEAKGMGLEVIAHTEQGRQKQKKPEDEAMAAQARREWEDEVLDEARKQLPYSAQGTYSLKGDFEDRPSEWDVRARQAAADAIRQLGNDAPFSEIRASAIQAGKRVAQEYKHHQACERVVAEVWLPQGTASDDQAAREAVRQALKKLPVGSGQAEMGKVRDAALTRFMRAEAKAKTARKAAEARARVEREVDSHLYRVDSYLGELEAAGNGWDFDGKRNEYAEKIKQEIRAALIEDLPHDWSARRARVEKLVDEWLAGHLTART